MHKVKKQAFFSIQNFVILLKSIGILLLFLYAFVPFETSNPNFVSQIKIITSFFIVLIAWYYVNYRFFLKKRAIYLLFFILFLTVVNTFYSDYGSYGFPQMINAAFFGFIVSDALMRKKEFRDIFVVTLMAIFILSVSMLLLQLMNYWLSGNILKIHEFFFPMSSARISIVETYDNFARMGGLYIEPGTYSNFIYLYLVVLLMITKNYHSMIIPIVGATMIISNSAWGIIFGLYLLLLWMIFFIFKKIIKQFVRRPLLTLLLFIFLIIILIWGIDIMLHSNSFEYMLEKFTSTGGSTTAKKDFYREYIENFSDFFIFGEGTGSKFLKSLESSQDSGLFLNLTVVMGILPTFMILLGYIVFLFNKKTFFLLLVSLPVLISKVNYVDPLFWLLIFMAYRIKDQKKEHIKEHS